MANLIIKPASNGSLILQDEGGDAALTVGTTGVSTIANATITTGTITAATFPAGHILQVVSGTAAGVMSTTSTTHPGSSSGLQVVITPASASNKIFIKVDLGIVTQSVGTGGTVGLSLYSTLTSGLIGEGTASGNRKGVNSRVAANWNADGNHGWGTGFSYLDSPSSWSSGAITYKVYIWAQGGTAYINRTDSDTNVVDSYGARTSSTITAMEVQG